MDLARRLFLVIPIGITAVSCAGTGAQTAQAPLIKKEKISTGDEPHLPDSLYLSMLMPGCGGSVVGAYKLCIAKEGFINSVQVVQGIPEADDAIMETLRRWRYKPLHIPVCFVQNLQFQIKCQLPLSPPLADELAWPTEPPQTGSPPPADPKLVAVAERYDHVVFQTIRGYPVAFGEKAGVRYIEVLDPRSGKTLSTHKLPSAP